MNKEYPRVLVLILASDSNPLYCAFQMMWRTYMKSNPNIQAYFYKAHPDISHSAFLADENTLLLKMHDTIDTCYEKTLRAFEYFIGDLDSYDYIFRPNLSSFVYFPHYLEYCKTLPKTGCCAAFVGTRSEDGLQFPAGAGFTLSPDIVKRLLAERPTLNIQDDVTIGYALQKWNIPIIPAPRFDVLIEAITNQLSHINTEEKQLFHFRLKNVEGNRQADITSFITLIKKYYKIQL